MLRRSVGVVRRFREASPTENVGPEVVNPAHLVFSIHLPRLFRTRHLSQFGELAVSIAQLKRDQDISAHPFFVRYLGSRDMGQRRKLNGLRIVITGASQGIGKALAE